MKKTLAATLFTLLCLSFLPPAAMAADVKIGVFCPLTGAFASEGQDMRAIIEMLAEQFNATTEGNKIALLIEDDGSAPRTAALAAQRLISNGAVAIIGTYGSTITEAAQGIIHNAKVVQIATAGTATHLTEKNYPLFLRTCPANAEQGRVAAELLRKKNYQRIAILHDNSSYGKGLADEIDARLKDVGIYTPVFFDALNPGERDYSATLTKIKNSNPDVIFFTGYYQEAGMLLRQMEEMQWQVPVIGGDAANNSDIVKIAGKSAAEGYQFISPPMPSDLGSELATNFIASYKAKYNTLPTSIWSVAAGDAFLVLAQAVQAGKTDATGIAAFLKNDLIDYNGLTGPIAFDAKGDRVGDLYRAYMINADGVAVPQ